MRLLVGLTGLAVIATACGADSSGTSPGVPGLGGSGGSGGHSGAGGSTNIAGEHLDGGAGAIADGGGQEGGAGGMGGTSDAGGMGSASGGAPNDGGGSDGGSSADAGGSAAPPCAEVKALVLAYKAAHPGNGGKDWDINAKTPGQIAADPAAKQLLSLCGPDQRPVIPLIAWEYGGMDHQSDQPGHVGSRLLRLHSSQHCILALATRCSTGSSHRRRVREVSRPKIHVRTSKV